MGYFGGLGAGKGWQTLNFLLTPEELEQLLLARPLHLVVGNARVPATYEQTPIAEYAETYRIFVAALKGDRELDWRVTQPLYMGLTFSMNIISFRPYSEAYKGTVAAEPLVNLSPFEVHYYHGTVCTTMLGNHMFSLGLSLQYPKVVSFDGEQHEHLHDASLLTNFELFMWLRDRITAQTVPCKIQSPTKVHRTRMRISSEMRGQLAEHRGLLAQGLRVL